MHSHIKSTKQAHGTKPHIYTNICLINKNISEVFYSHLLECARESSSLNIDQMLLQAERGLSNSSWELVVIQ